MPAEWEPHRATWIGWPHHEPDWPGKFAAIPWVYAEIVRALAAYERVEILCHSPEVLASARELVAAHGAPADRVRMHVVPIDRVWLRDSAPTAVVDANGTTRLLDWRFTAWAKYDNWRLDDAIGAAIAGITGLARVTPRRADTGDAVVLEGGGIDVNGQGLLLVTEEWLLSPVQIRNPGLTRPDYERLFAEWLGIRRTIWLGEGCAGDDTHGHVDDVARFVAADTVVVAVEPDPADENHRRSLDNVRRLELAAADPDTGPLRIVHLPFPRRVEMRGERLPASYANFYIANGVVLVPTFNDPSDRLALAILAELMPSHRAIGIHAVDLVWGLGTLHCLTQQEPEGGHRPTRSETVIAAPGIRTPAISW
jgi:agmatine deiminase